MAENEPTKKRIPRKSPAQRNELTINYSPATNLYTIDSKKGATTPEELGGSWTSAKFAERAIDLHFRK